MSLLKLAEADSGQLLVGYYRLEHARINFPIVPRQASRKRVFRMKRVIRPMA